jgi:DNA-binding transcriptional ArsR family regulator
MGIAPNRISDYVPPTLDRFSDADLAAKAGPGERTRRREAPSVAGLLRVLNDPTRLKLLLLLVGGERSVTQLCRDLSMPQPTVSHHLARLRLSHLVEPRKSGKHVYYAAGPTVAADADWLSVGTVRIRLLNDA